MVVAYGELTRTTPVHAAIPTRQRGFGNTPDGRLEAPNISHSGHPGVILHSG